MDFTSFSLTVLSRHKRIPSQKSYYRPKIPSHEAEFASTKGFQSGGLLDWSVLKPLESFIISQYKGHKYNVTLSDVYERALLVQSNTHYQPIRDANLNLKENLPDKEWVGGNWAENLHIGGTLNTNTLCIGDILTTPNSSVVLQVSSPRRPCSRVDVQFGKTYDGNGVRSFCAKTGTSGFFVRVLKTGDINDGDVFKITKRLWPMYSLARVSALLYGMKGGCEKASGYALPGKGTLHGKTAKNALGGDAQYIASMWKGTYKELQELASMKELAAFEWKEEFQAILASWDGMDTELEKRSSGVLYMVLVVVIVAAVAVVVKLAMGVVHVHMYYGNTTL
jgi:MOSC domain-containing protein YiiM